MTLTSHEIMVLGAAEVLRLFPMREAVRVMETALAALARGEAVQPLRTFMFTKDGAGILGLMPAQLQTPAALGLKAVTIFPNNARLGLDTHQGAVLLFDAGTGRLLSLLDGGAITAIRTAAVSAVATAHLANEAATELAILGSGVQARTHLEAILCVRKIERVRIWSRTPEHARALAEEMAQRYQLEVIPVRQAELAVREAHIIVTVTAAKTPILYGEWLTPGVHLNAVGASLPDARELDTQAVKRSKLIVDSVESALAEAGDILIPISEGALTTDHIHATLGEVIIRAKEGRATASEITLFKSLGLGIEDVAAAQFIYQRAREERMRDERDEGIEEVKS